MQREIKFRGINKLNGNFVYGYYYVDKVLHHIHSGHTIYVVDKNTVGQFTGLTDKNGVEIYEGDMLRHKIGGICYVVWEDAAFAVKSQGSDAVDWEHSSWYSDTEVIGNNIRTHIY